MIGADVLAALPTMRAHAASLMTDTCTIDRGTTTWDEDTQRSTTTWATVHAAASCHVANLSGSLRALLTDEAVTPATPMVKVSYLLTDIEPDDRLTVNGSVMWVTGAAPDDATHPVEVVIACRWVR